MSTWGKLNVQLVSVKHNLDVKYPKLSPHILILFSYTLLWIILGIHFLMKWIIVKWYTDLHVGEFCLLGHSCLLPRKTLGVYSRDLYLRSVSNGKKLRLQKSQDCFIIPNTKSMKLCHQISVEIKGKKCQCLNTFGIKMRDATSWQISLANISICFVLEFVWEF